METESASHTDNIAVNSGSISTIDESVTNLSGSLEATQTEVTGLTTQGESSADTIPYERYHMVHFKQSI